MNLVHNGDAAALDRVGLSRSVLSLTGNGLGRWVSAVIWLLRSTFWLNVTLRN